MRRYFSTYFLLSTFYLLLLTTPSSALTFEVTAPQSLARVAGEVRALDPSSIQRALDAAGLTAPPVVHVTLIPEDDVAARETPRWIVAFASGTDRATIFPGRVGDYPYPSLQSVVTHEIAHLALSLAAGGAPLPRWFHEGVAVSVESGWGTLNDARLFIAAFSRPHIDDLGALFAADEAHQSEEAYLLAAAVVADVRERHGSDAPGRIAHRVAAGLPFDAAFDREIGETPDATASRAWRAYRRWTAWLPMLTDGTALWSGILALAVVAFIVRRRRRALRRRRWDEDELGWTRPD